MILGSFFISKIQGKSSDLRMFFLTTVLMSVPILLIAKLNVFLPVFIGYLVHEAGRGMKAPMHKMFINRNIPSDKRATIISYDSAIENLGGATGLLLLGWVGKNYSISSAWLISGGLLLLLLPIYRKACHADGAVPKIS
jgi:predicted MFS family arabinose efflux permease